MAYFISLFSLLLSLNTYSHGGDDGPSSLEQEFAKLSHIHLPVNYSTHHGLALGYKFGAHEDEASEEAEAGDEAPDLNLHPVFFGGYDKIRRLICLDESREQRIELCDENVPHLLLENKKWDLGLGGEVDLHLPIPYVGVGGGITYLKGKNYVSFKVLNNRNEKRSRLNFPTSKSEFENWRVGDQLTFMSKGSVILNVFIGIEPFFHMGPEFIHTGIHRVSAKKTADEILQVEFTVVKSNSVGFEGNAIVLNSEFSKSSGRSNSVTYEFHLNDENDYEGIRALFSGRLNVTNKLMLNSDGEIILKTNFKNKGRSFSGSLGLPVVYFNGVSKGTYHSNGEVEEYEEDEIHHHQVYSSIKAKEHFTRGVLSKHSWESQSLISTIVRDEHESNGSILSTVKNWSFSRDRVRSAQFARKMDKLARLTGLKDFKAVKLPKGTEGYVKVDVSINLSGDHILAILSKQEKLVLESFQKKKDYMGLNKSLLNFMHQIFKSREEIFYKAKFPVVEIRLEGQNLKKTLVRIP